MVTIKAPAKINLALDTLYKREDNYHEVEMVMTTVDLADYITVTPLEKNEIKIKSNEFTMPLNEKNLAYQAAKLFKEHFNIDKGVEIYIKKRIPVAAGLAGGSSNAAATLKALKELWQVDCTIDELAELGAKLGSDVPFCVYGGTALATGRGEKIQQIPSPPKCWVILIKPRIGVSTKEVYECIDSKDIDKRPNNKFLIECLKNEDTRQLAENMFNVLEGVTMDKHPVIQQIKDIMTNNRALGAMMSGSGPTVFGLYENREDAVKCKAILEKQFKQTFVVACEEKGVEVNG